MTKSNPALEVVFQMTNSRKFHFFEQDQANARAFMDNLKPQKFFSEASVLVAGDLKLSGLSTSSIAWVAFKTDIKPEWHYPAHIQKVDVINKQIFENALKTEVRKSKDIITNSQQGGRPVKIYWQALTAEGTTWFFRVHSQTLINIEKISVPRIIRDLPSFYAVSPNGGGVILNMQNVISWTSHPGPVELPPGVWTFSEP